MSADIQELLTNLLLGAAAGEDKNLLQANAVHQLGQNGQEQLIAIGSQLFTESGQPLYDRIEDHVTHEMLTILDMHAQETNYLLRAILTALTAGSPVVVDDLIPDSPAELVEQAPEPEKVPA